MLAIVVFLSVYKRYTVEPLLRGHSDERPPPLERPLGYANVYINVLIFTPNKRPPLLKGQFSDAQGVDSQEGFHCSSNCRRCQQDLIIVM